VHWGALIAGFGLGLAVYAMFPEIEWELRRLQRVRRLKRCRGYIQ
jgi:hypothetical protein